ncbi:MAG: hypothetical protein NE328_12900, partial [Lentisphaeraceae bacterium]|nr:hypothetical protein [Lentisphaeraceae bacterium]
MSKTIKYTILFIYSVISIIVISVSLFDLLKCLIHFTNLSYNDFLLNIFEKLFPLLVFLIYCFPLLLINRYFLFKQNETKAKYLNLLGKVILGIFILFTFIPNSLISRSKYSKIEEHWQSYRTTFDEVIRTPFLDGEKLKLKTLSITIPKTLNREDFKINESLPVSFYGEINYKDFDVDFYAFYKFFN